MKTTQYLYECNVSEFKDLPYKEALLLKKEKAKQVMYNLVYNDNMEDNQRMNDVNEAIRFNETLLQELEG